MGGSNDLRSFEAALSKKIRDVCKFRRRGLKFFLNVSPPVQISFVLRNPRDRASLEDCNDSSHEHTISASSRHINKSRWGLVKEDPRYTGAGTETEQVDLAYTRHKAMERDCNPSALLGRDQ
jgi:hypothetical protein